MENSTFTVKRELVEVIKLIRIILLMKNIKAIQVVLWASVILWMFIIFLLSGQNAKESSNLSTGITEKIIEIIVPSFNDMSVLEKADIMDSIHHIVRKTAHAAAYFMLGILCISVMQTNLIKPFKKIILSLGICLVYAISDETHQAFIPGRGPSPYDVGIDFCGSLIGILVFLLILTIYKNIKKKVAES